MIPVLITDTFTSAESTPAQGRVTFLLAAPLTSSTTGVRVAAAPIGAALDPQGRIAVTLAATDDPDLIAPAFYRVTEAITGQDPTTYLITVPYLSPNGTIPLGLCPRG